MRTVRTIRARCALVLFVSLALASCQAKYLLADSSTPVHWRVTWTGDPSASATVSWDTPYEGTEHQLLLRADGVEEEIIPAHRNGPYSRQAGTDQWHYHHVRLTELQPDTKYFVTLESDGERSPELHFVTASNDGEPFSLLFGGDSRSGHEARRQMNAVLARIVQEQENAGRPPVLALLHGGDFIRNGLNLHEWLQWLEDHQITSGSDGRLLPIIPARGNHDPGPIFNEVFDFPASHRNYYAINFGDLLHLTTLNTETSTAGDQEAWLAEELAAARAGHRWLVAQYHKPAYPAVKIPSGAYVSWVPLFEEHNVDLVCEADGHCIKRTPPIRDNKFDATGVVYIGEGGLGVGQRTPKTGRWYLDHPDAATGIGHHVQLLTISPDSLVCRTLMMDGTLFDEYIMEPRTQEVRSGE